MTPKNAFQIVVDALLDDSNPFPQHHLFLFSDIEPGQLKLLLTNWQHVSLARKCALLEDLEEIAKEDTLLCFDDLARALLQDTDPEVRVRALHLLWECEDAKLVPTFIKILNEDSEHNVRAAAATALGLFIYLGEIEEIAEQTLHQVEDSLLAVLHSNNDTLVRRRTLEALGCSSRQEVPALIEAGYTERNVDWKASALFAMGRSGDECWGKYVLSNLRNRNEAIHLEALRAAGELALASARPILLDMLADEEDVEIRHEIIWVLSKIGGEEVNDRLQELLAMTDEEEETEFLEEALENLAFTEELSNFDLLNLEDE